MPDGEDITVGFSLAFVSDPRAPWIGLFACQHFRPDYYAQARYLAHANTAHGVRRRVDFRRDGALDLADFMAKVTGIAAARKPTAGCVGFETRYGDVVLAEPAVFEDAFGEKPPHPEDGPHLAGFTIACGTLESFGELGLKLIGGQLRAARIAKFRNRP